MLTDENKTQDEQKEVSAEVETVEVDPPAEGEKPTVEQVAEIPKVEEVIIDPNPPIVDGQEKKPISAEPKLEEEIVAENIESEAPESPEVVEVKSEQSEQIEKSTIEQPKVEQTESVPVAPDSPSAPQTQSNPTPPPAPKPEVRVETPNSPTANGQVKTVEKIVYKTDPNIVTNLLNKARATIQERKRRKLDKIMTLFETKSQIRSRDIQRLLFAKKRTVTNYLNQLESEKKIIQVGKTGKGALYIKTP